MPSLSKPRRVRVRPRVKVWLEIDDQHAFCSGMCRILQAVDRTGSIKHAASEVGRSYRFVWGRIKEAELACGFVLVDAHVGGGKERRSFLTPAGRLLLDGFVRLQEKLHQASDECAGELRHLRQRASS